MPFLPRLSSVALLGYFGAVTRLLLTKTPIGDLRPTLITFGVSRLQTSNECLMTDLDTLFPSSDGSR
jgi:hypothetical protein